MASFLDSSSRTFDDDDDDYTTDISDDYGDPTLLESFWLFVLGDEEEQHKGRRGFRGQRRDDTATADKRDEPPEVRSTDLSEAPELVRNFSFWRRKKQQQQQQQEQLQEAEAALALDRPSLGEEETEQRDVEEGWSWEFDKEAFSLSAGGSSERESNSQSNTTTMEAQSFDDRRTGGRWMENLHGRGKNNILARTLHGRRTAPAVEEVNAVDEARDELEVVKASTWHFELDTDALGFGRSTSIDDDDEGNEAKSVGGWSLFAGGRMPAEKEKPKGMFLAAVPLVRRLSTRK